MWSRGAWALRLESDGAHWLLPDLAFRCFDWDNLEYGIPKGLGCSSVVLPSARMPVFRAGLVFLGSGSMRGVGPPLGCHWCGPAVAGFTFLGELWVPSARRNRGAPGVLEVGPPGWCNCWPWERKDTVRNSRGHTRQGGSIVLCKRLSPGTARPGFTSWLCHSPVGFHVFPQFPHL